MSETEECEKVVQSNFSVYVCLCVCMGVVDIHARICSTNVWVIVSVFISIFDLKIYLGD